VIDESGTMWLVSGPNHTIRGYTVAQRSVDGDTTAASTITDTTLIEPLSAAMDSHGTLWVGDAGILRGYTASQLAAGGSQGASILVNSYGLTPGLAFDGSGNLWATSCDSNAVVMYTAAQLAASGSPTPTTVITAPPGLLVCPAGAAFDTHGNLWIANDGADSIVMFASNQLTASGTVTPGVVLAPPTSLNALWAIAFDARGSLWVDGFGGKIASFSSAQLSAGGTPTPTVIISGSEFNAPSGMAFDAWLPTGTSGTGLRRIRGARVSTRSIVAARGPHLTGFRSYHR
jgi:hypothetical protein